jgi:threonyl-tRNA synthetase
VWKKAETNMRAFLKTFKIPFVEALGEAAFYGPKMDLMCKTAIGHEWQLATIQLDYIMPERFGLTYTAPDGSEAPVVMIHKAMAGSLERFLGILLEHFYGNLPVWMSPIQVHIVPVASRHRTAAARFAKKLSASAVRVYVDDANETVGNKIRKATMLRVPYLLVFGDKEKALTKLAVRIRGVNTVKSMSLSAFVKRVQNDISKRKRA